MKKILLIAYYFPPLGSIGARRTIRYVRNLHKFGWKPYVITPRKWAYGEVEAFWDNSETDEVLNYAEIYRTNFIDITKINRFITFIPYLRRYTPSLNRFLSYFPPEHCLGWLPFALLKAKEIIKMNNIDIIYSTSAPYLAHIIAYLLKKSTGTPWIADLRDEWSLHPYRKPLFHCQKALDQKLEKMCLSAADRIVTVSNLYKQQFLEILQGDRNDITVITNGYRKEDFTNIPRNNSSNRMIITYCGLFYGTRSPESFIRALNELVGGGLLNAEKIRVNFIGPKMPNPWQRFASNPWRQVFNWVGFVPHKTAIKYMMNSDLLLYISSGRGKGNIQGKVFEYIASRKPILVLAEELDEGIQIIESTGLMYANVDVNDVQSIQAQIIGFYKDWLNGKIETQVNMPNILEYEETNLTNRLSMLLDSLIPK